MIQRISAPAAMFDTNNIPTNCANYMQKTEHHRFANCESVVFFVKYFAEAKSEVITYAIVKFCFAK